MREWIWIQTRDVWHENNPLFRRAGPAKTSVPSQGVVSKSFARSRKEGNAIRWAYSFLVFIAEIGKYLRVVTLEDGETVHNAFPDRDFGKEADQK
jgi:hypothetical protein